MADFVAGGREHQRLDRRLHAVQDLGHQVQNAQLSLVREIEGFAVQLRVSRQGFGQVHVGRRAVFHVEIIADEMPVAANHRPLAAEHRADRARHDAIPIQVPPAVEIAAARDGHGQSVRQRIAAGDQVGAGLADVVRVPWIERRRFAIGELLLIAVGLVARGHHDLLDARTAAAGFQQGPGARHIALERRDRVGVGHTHDGLGRQVQHGVDLILSQHALQQRLIANVAPHGRHPVE